MLSIPINRTNINQVIHFMNGCGIYSFKDFDSKIIYIGQSLDLRKRFFCHKNWLFKLVALEMISEVGYMMVAPEDLDDVESRAIRYHRPIFNKRDNPDMRKPKYKKMSFMVPQWFSPDLLNAFDMSMTTDDKEESVEQLETSDVLF